jgi:tRNA1(Val) A37 N6-methylase TrmN6
MTTNDIEILLVEDNPRDAEMALRALRKQNLANKVHVAKDGAEALDSSSPGAPTRTETRTTYRRWCSSISSSPRSAAWRC